MSWIQDELDLIHATLARIERALISINRKEQHMAGELDKLEADVAAEAGVIASAVTLLQGLKAALDAAIASGDMSRVVAVNAQIEAQTQALADAVAANPLP